MAVRLTLLKEEFKIKANNGFNLKLDCKFQIWE